MIYAIGVDISIAFRKDIYYFRYKDVDFKYVPHYKIGETDDLVCKVLKGSSQPKMFELMTEFLSAFAFANNAKVIAHSGIGSQVDAKFVKKGDRFILLTLRALHDIVLPRGELRCQEGHAQSFLKFHTTSFIEATIASRSSEKTKITIS